MHLCQFIYDLKPVTDVADSNSSSHLNGSQIIFGGTILDPNGIFFEISSKAEFRLASEVALAPPMSSGRGLGAAPSGV